MEPLFLGGHPALDFLNTAFTPGDEPVELLGDGRALLDWLVAADLLAHADAARLQRRLGSKGLDAAAADVRKLREWARAWLERWRASPDADYDDELLTLNKQLARALIRREVVRTEQGLRLITRAEVDDAATLLALLAGQLAALVTDEQAALVKACAGSDCTLWFVDRTKAHRRVFCSPAVCGNRAKVAAFRQRQRE